MADQRLQWELIAKDAASSVIKEVQKNQKDLVKTIKDAVQATKESADANKSASLSFKDLVGGVALGNAIYSTFTSIVRGATRTLRDFAGDSLESALTVERLQTTIYGLGENMGRTREEVDGIISSIREENKSMREAMEITQGIVIANLDAADAQTLLTIARDTGAATGVSSAEANRLITQSLQSLKVAQLERIGLVISERVAYDEYADKMGLVRSEMDATAKRQAIWEQIKKEGIKFQGQYNLSMTTGQKVLGSMRDAFEDVRTVVGKLLSDAVEPMAKATLDMIRDFRAWAYTADNELNPELQAIADTIYGTLVPAFLVLMEVVKEFGAGVWRVLTNVNAAVEGTGKKTEEEVAKNQQTMRTWGAVISSFAVMLVTTFKLIGRVILGAVQIVVGGIANIWNTMLGALETGANQVLSIVKGIIKAINMVFSAVGKDPIVFDAQINFGGARINAASDLAAMGLGNIGGGAVDFIEDMWNMSDMQNAIITPPVPESDSMAKKGKESGYAWLDGLQEAVESAGGGAGADMMEKLADSVDKLVENYDDAVFDIEEDLIKLEDAHAKEIDRIVSNINDLKSELSELEQAYSDTMGELSKDEAERVVEQEQFIQDLKDQLEEMQLEGGDTTEIQALQDQLDDEESAYKDYMATREGLDEELSEARRRSELSDFERFVEDITARRDEETLAYEEKRTQLENEIAILEESKEKEIAIYEAKRSKYLELKDTFQEFHDSYLTNISSMEAQTEESVANMADRLEDLKRIMSELDSLQSNRAIVQSVEGNNSANASGETKVNNINITVNGAGGSDQNTADTIMRELELNGLGSTS